MVAENVISFFEIQTNSFRDEHEFGDSQYAKNLYYISALSQLGTILPKNVLDVAFIIIP